MTEFYTTRKLSELVLRDRGHNCQSKLGILVEGVDIVVLKKHAYAATEKLTGELYGIQDVTGKT